jgi:hypothetical protein
LNAVTLAYVSGRQCGIGRNGQGSRDGQAHLLRRFLLLRHCAGRSHERGKHKKYKGDKSLFHAILLGILVANIRLISMTNKTSYVHTDLPLVRNYVLHVLLIPALKILVGLATLCFQSHVRWPIRYGRIYTRIRFLVMLIEPSATALHHFSSKLREVGRELV